MMLILEQRHDLLLCLLLVEQYICNGLLGDLSLLGLISLLREKSSLLVVK